MSAKEAIIEFLKEHPHHYTYLCDIKTYVTYYKKFSDEEYKTALSELVTDGKIRIECVKARLLKVE